MPVEVADQAVRAARAADADGCVAVGGGSAIGLGKAIALRTELPLIAVPSTYSGSEMTPVWGLTEHGAKRTGRAPRSCRAVSSTTPNSPSPSRCPSP